MLGAAGIAAEAGAASPRAGRILVRAASSGGVAVTPHPFSLSFVDGGGRAVLSEVENTGQAPAVLAAPLEPEPLGADNLHPPALYAPLGFTVGAARDVQQPAAQWEGTELTGAAAGVQYSARDLLDAEREGNGVKLTVSTSDPSGRLLIVKLKPGPRGTIRVSVRPSPADGVAVMADSFTSGTDEAFRGFGGRHDALDQRGRDFYNWTEQENFGAGPLQPLANLIPNAGGESYLFPNGPTAAYYVQTSFVSSRPYGFMLERPELSRFRLAYDRPDVWQISAAAPGLDYLVAPGSAPRAIAALTAIGGRQRVPPRWAAGTMLDRLTRVLRGENAQTYGAAVDADLRDIARYHLPLDGYRIEGWPLLGRDKLRAVIAELHRRGIHALLYFRSFVADDGAGTEDAGAYQYAVDHGYVATGALGLPYLFEGNFPGKPAAVIDFTNPDAVAWWQGRVREALDLGADGFMQDFGEQVQVDMRFADGETGATMHNRYPVLYHRATRAVFDAYEHSHPGRKLFFFTRAGYSGAPGSARYENGNFPGDETTDWGRASGIASIVPDMLNRAIGGAYGFTMDIGGYADVHTPATTKELFVRWAELAALSPFFRLHGSASAGTHTPWSYDTQTVDIYNRLSRLHLAARSLILRLWRRAVRTGMPVTRPLWLAYPHDQRAAAQDQEWLLGPDVLVAPVVQEHADSRAVYFPAGCWRSPETGARFRGPRSQTVAAPLTRLPYFFRCGRRPFKVPR